MPRTPNTMLAQRLILFAEERGQADAVIRALFRALFQEGREAKAERAFREIARLSRGAYCPFDAGSAKQLRELLTAVAVYATGGRKALQDFSDETKSGAALRLLEQLG
jgi:hypothetical protein